MARRDIPIEYRCIGITNSKKRCSFKHHITDNKCRYHYGINQCGVVLVEGEEKYCNLRLNPNGECNKHPYRITNNMPTLYSILAANTNTNTNTNVGNIDTTTNTGNMDTNGILNRNVRTNRQPINNNTSIRDLDIYSGYFDRYLGDLAIYDNNFRINRRPINNNTSIGDIYDNMITTFNEQDNAIVNRISTQLYPILIDELSNLYPNIDRDFIYSTILSNNNRYLHRLVTRHVESLSSRYQTYTTTTKTIYKANEPKVLNELERKGDCNICYTPDEELSNIYKCCNNGKNICKGCVKEYYTNKNIPNPPCPFCRGNPSTKAIVSQSNPINLL